MTVADLRRTLAKLSEVPEPALKAACKAVETIAAQEGGSVVLGRKQRRVKLKAITRIKDHGDEIKATVWGTPTGPWVWKNTGRDGGYNIPKRKPTKRSPRTMHADGYPHPVNVNGQRIQFKGGRTSGSHAWDKVVKRAERVVPEIIGKAVHEVVTRG